MRSEHGGSALRYQLLFSGIDARAGHLALPAARTRGGYTRPFMGLQNPVQRVEHGVGCLYHDGMTRPIQNAYIRRRQRISERFS